MHNNHLINLIKELAAANNKLKSDLVEYKEMLSDSRNELHSLRSKVEEMENGDPTASIKTASSIAGTAASSRHGSPTGSVTPTADEFAGMLPNVKHSLMVEQQQSLAFLSSSAPQPTSMMMFGAAAVGRLSPDLERSKSRERSTREGSRERPITPVDRIRSRRSIDVISAAAAQLANEPSTPSSSVPTTPSTPTFNRTARPGPISITTVPLSSSSTSTSATGIGSVPHSPLGSPSVVHHHHHHYHYHVHRRKGSMQLDPNAPPGAAGALGGVHGNDDETETVEIVKEEVVVKMQPGTHSAPVSRASSPSRPADFQEGGRRVGFVVEKLHGMAGESPPAIKKTAVGSPSLLSASLASLGKDKGLGSAIIVPGGGDNERRVTIGFPEPTASSSDTVSGGHARRPSTADGKRRDMGIGYFAPPFNQIGGDGERRGRGFGSWREPIVTRVTVVGVSEDELAERMRDAATSPISEFNRQLPAPGGEGLAGRRGSQAKVQQSGKRGTAPLPLALSAPSMSRMFATPPPASPRGSIASQSSSASGGGGLQNPYVALHNLGANLLERLRGTDIRALNRRLKRTFDILELSGMSNSIIENVLSDVEVLRERFRWVEEAWKDKEAAAGADGTTTPNNAKTEEGGGKEKERERERERKLEALLAGVSVDEFLPLLHMVQDLLGEVGKLRMTVNDLQVEYVKKVEENQRWVEEGIVRRAERRAARHHEGWEGGGVTAGAGKFAWLASVLVGYRGRTGKNGRGPAWNPWRPAMLRTAADDHRGRNTDRRVGKHTQSMDRNQGQGERKGHVRSVSHDSVTSMLLDRQDTEGSGTHNGGSASDSMNGTNSSSSGTVPTPTSPVSRGRPPHRDLISAATTTVKVSAMDVPNTGNRRWSDSSLVAEGKGKGKGKGKEGDELIPGTGYKGATSYLSSSVFEEKGSQWRGGGMAGTEAANTTLGAKYGPPPGHFSSAARAISEKRRLRLSEQSMNSNSRRDEDENKDAVSPKATPSQILSSPTAPTQPPQRTSTITITTPSSPRALYPRTSNIPISPQPGGSAPRSRNMPIPRGSSSTPIRNQRGRSRDPGDARAADGSWRSRPPSPDADQDPTWKAGSMFAAGWMGTK
ncbi:hypothetical protein BC936DRAFT_141644 [Jimgerdemannia flammicorona]|uniref:Uncharacterized protein n=1 Tax=Jimgerdemannia flammicorona TaxID=994334 RepID=A0A433A1V6_9FUNG|nr:hypothetical protein BC936DRAFT_141644 [Jimgerdemannia flammicorona]